MTGCRAVSSGGIVRRYVLPCRLALGPMLLAGIILARSFRDEPNPEDALRAPRNDGAT